MSLCNDYWCEDYGKGNEKCDRCVNKDAYVDRPDLRVILKRRADELVEIDKTLEKGHGQSR